MSWKEVSPIFISANLWEPTEGAKEILTSNPRTRATVRPWEGDSWSEIGVCAFLVCQLRCKLQVIASCEWLKPGAGQTILCQKKLMTSIILLPFIIIHCHYHYITNITISIRGNYSCNSDTPGGVSISTTNQHFWEETLEFRSILRMSTAAEQKWTRVLMMIEITFRIY